METMDFSNRSKQHANNNHKNQQLQKSLLQQQKQQQQHQEKQTLPITSTTIKTLHHTTTTTSTTPTPDTTVSSTYVPRNDIRTSTTLRTYSQKQPKTTTVEIQKSVEIEASSLQSLEYVETISDESQNIQITHERDEYPTTQRNKIIDYVITEGFATSPRGNLLHENSEKPYRGKSSQELGKIYQLSKENEHYYGKSSEYKIPDDNKEQRKRVNTFILSDVTPQQFKPSEKEPEDETSVEFIKSASSSSTTQRYVPVTDPKPFQYSLQTGANGFSLRAENIPLTASNNDDENEENDVPLYRRPQLAQKASRITSSTETPTTTTSQSTTSAAITTSTVKKPTTRNLDSSDTEEVTPTTYSPSHRSWRTARPTTITPTFKNSLGTTERSIQSFTARATVFKDNLTKTTGPPAHRFVSPYKSLETILSEKEERFGINNLRTTSKPRYTSAASSPTPFIPPTSKQPLRSYFIITSTPRTLNDVIVTMSTNPRNFSISDAILSTFSTAGFRVADINTETTEPIVTKTTKSTTPLTIITTESTTIPTTSPDNFSNPKQRDSFSQEMGRPRGRSRYTVITQSPTLNTDEPTTYAPKFRFPAHTEEPTSSPSVKHYRRKVQRARIAAINGNQRLVNNVGKSREKYQSFKQLTQQHESQNQFPKTLNRKPIENESTVSEGPRAEALVAFALDNKQDNSIDDSRLESAPTSSSSTEQVISITDRPHKYFYSNKYRQLTAEHNLAEGLQNAGYLTSSTSRSRFRPKSVLEQLQLFLAGESDESESSQQIEDFTQPEIKAAVEEIKNLYTSTTTTTTLRPTTTPSPPTTAYVASSSPTTPDNPPTIPQTTTTRYTATSTLSHLPRYSTASYGGNTNSTLYHSSSISSNGGTTVSAAIPTTKSSLLMPMRASRVNNAIKSSIAAAAASSSTNSQAPASATTMGHRSHKVINGLSSSSSSSSLSSNSNVAAATFKCSDSTSNAKCNEIPSRYLN